MLKYYKVTDWMLAVGEGFTPCTGILALIHSFNENGTECKASTAYIAQFCGCGRRKVFSDLKYLIENGYITANRGAKTDIVGYTVNVDACKKAAAAYARDAQVLMQEMHKAYAPDAQAYAPDAQVLMHEMHTEKENMNKRNEKKKIIGEGEKIPTPKNHDSFSLSEEQKNHIIYGYDYNGCKHTANYYIELVKQYGYNKVLQFLADDAKPKTADEERQAREFAEDAQRLFDEYAV